MSPNKGNLLLAVRNYGFATSEALDLARSLDERRVVPLEKSLYQLTIRGISLNPHYSLFGRGVVLALALERLMFAMCRDKDRATTEELKSVLGILPELKESYRLLASGKSCKLILKAPRRRLTSRDWSAHDWSLILRLGHKNLFFEFKGAEFHSLLRLFSLLNGHHTESELSRKLPRQRGLLKRFLAFARQHKLLRVVRANSDEERPPLRFVSHACLEVSDGDGEGSILFDPVFFMPAPYDKKPAYYGAMEAAARRLNKTLGVFLSHYHWDHVHLPTLARLDRRTPIYVPRVKKQTHFNPSLYDYFKSLGFSRVQEVDWWQTIRTGGMEVLIVPSYGEFFTPDSYFNAFTYLIKSNGLSVFGAVDSYKNDRGDMRDVLIELKRRGHRVDLFCFSLSEERFSNPVFTGMPYVYSNDFYGNRFTPDMRYLADAKTLLRWFKISQPKFAIPYSEFIFHNPAGVGKHFKLSDRLEPHALSKQYWRSLSRDLIEPKYKLWKRDLEKIRKQFARRNIVMLMLGAGDGIEY